VCRGDADRRGPTARARSFFIFPSSAFETHSSTANGDEARRHLAPNVRIFPYAQTVTPRSPRANRPDTHRRPRRATPRARDRTSARPAVERRTRMFTVTASAVKPVVASQTPRANARKSAEAYVI